MFKNLWLLINPNNRYQETTYRIDIKIWLDQGFNKINNKHKRFIINKIHNSNNLFKTRAILMLPLNNRKTILIKHNRTRYFNKIRLKKQTLAKMNLMILKVLIIKLTIFHLQIKWIWLIQIQPLTSN